MTKLSANNIAAMTTLADRLHKAMKIAGKMPADLVRVTGAKSSSVHNWLNGRTQNLKGKNLVIVAQFLSVSDSWLADGVGPMQRKAGAWPFKKLDEEKVRTLGYDELLMIETAIILEAMKTFAINLSKD